MTSDRTSHRRPAQPPRTRGFEGSAPHLDPGGWVAPGAVLIGAVRLGANASVWYGSVVRADGDTIDIGAGSNVQDGCVLHADPGLPLTVGAGVSVGHRAVVHGCTVEDDSLIGMGTVILNGARIGPGCLVAAGTVVREGVIIPPNSLVAGVPGVVRRELSAEQQESLRENARTYVDLAARHRREEDEVTPPHRR